jgi:hypothetical protein
MLMKTEYTTEINPDPSIAISMIQMTIFVILLNLEEVVPDFFSNFFPTFYILQNTVYNRKN